jgi:hypothetical protein
MSDQPTNEELVQAIAGDVHVFYVLYDRAARLVRAVAADPGPDAAEDVTHDTLYSSGTVAVAAFRPRLPDATVCCA